MVRTIPTTNKILQTSSTEVSSKAAMQHCLFRNQCGSLVVVDPPWIFARFSMGTIEAIIGTSSIEEGNSTISNFVVTSALRCQCQYSRRLRRGLSLLEVLGLQSRWLGRQFSIRHPGSRKRATKTWRLLNLYTVSSLQIQSMSNLKNEQLEEWTTAKISRASLLPQRSQELRSHPQMPWCRLDWQSKCFN